MGKAKHLARAGRTRGYVVRWIPAGAPHIVRDLLSTYGRGPARYFKLESVTGWEWTEGNNPSWKDVEPAARLLVHLQGATMTFHREAALAVHDLLESRLPYTVDVMQTWNTTKGKP